MERRWIGGSCPNINCLPSKNEIWSAKVADLVRHAARFGTSTIFVPGRGAAGPLTNIEALELDRLPAHLIVLGSGYVGLELAQAYRRFGSRVTIIEYGPQLAGREDPDVADEIRRIFSGEGIDVLLSAEVIRVQ